MTRESADLIDQGAPRTNQATIALLLVVLYGIDQPGWILAIVAVLYVGVGLGRRFVPGYFLWFAVIRPRLSDVYVEDERAPRFAQAMGASGLLAGYALIESGSPSAGWGLVLSLAVAALFAAVTGICLGCWTYRLFAKLGGVAPTWPAKIEPGEIDLPEMTDGETALVAFGHPLCSDCRTWEERLRSGPRPFVTIDVRERPDLARRYGVALLPTVLEVAGDGRILRQVAP